MLVEFVTLTSYGSLSVGKVDFATTAVICPELSVVVLEALYSVPLLPINFTVDDSKDEPVIVNV